MVFGDALFMKAFTRASISRNVNNNNLQVSERYVITFLCEDAAERRVEWSAAECGYGLDAM